MVDAKTMGDSQACYGKLTKAQQDGMNAAAMALAADGVPVRTDTTGSAAATGSADGAGSPAPIGSAAEPK